jgi:hypothetical protein
MSPPKKFFTDFTMDKATTIRNFLEISGSTIVSVQFMKKDGTLRKIQFNPKDRNEIKGFGPSTQSPNIIRVRDFKIAKNQGQGAWRSFDINRIVSITANGSTYNFT